MSTPALAKPFAARPATPQDAKAVVAVCAAAQEADNGSVDTSLEDVRSDWARPSFDLEADTLLVVRGGDVVAYAYEFGQRAFVQVAPEVRGQGIGTALVAWTEERARSRGVPCVGQTLSEHETAARRLLAAHGYEVRWDSWVFQLDLTASVAPPQVCVPGLTLRPVRRPDEDRALHELIETAFSEWRGREPSTSFEDWRAGQLDRPDTDPGLILVLGDGERLVGAAVSVRFGDEGWIEQLAVARSHRGRGLASWLLAASFAEFRRRGLRTAGLSTDSRTGARDLYERVGMTVTRSYARFAKDLD